MGGDRDSGHGGGVVMLHVDGGVRDGAAVPTQGGAANEAPRLARRLARWFSRRLSRQRRAWPQGRRHAVSPDEASFNANEAAVNSDEAAIGPDEAAVNPNCAGAVGADEAAVNPNCAGAVGADETSVDASSSGAISPDANPDSAGAVRPDADPDRAGAVGSDEATLDAGCTAASVLHPAVGGQHVPGGHPEAERVRANPGGHPWEPPAERLLRAAGHRGAGRGDMPVRGHQRRRPRHHQHPRQARRHRHHPHHLRLQSPPQALLPLTFRNLAIIILRIPTTMVVENKAYLFDYALVIS